MTTLRILVRARDDFEVQAVEITIRFPNGAVLESGPTHRAPEDAELFRYAATSAPGGGREVQGEAAATDWPGNRTIQTAASVVAGRGQANLPAVARSSLGCPSVIPWSIFSGPADSWGSDAPVAFRCRHP